MFPEGLSGTRCMCRTPEAWAGGLLGRRQQELQAAFSGLLPQAPPHPRNAFHTGWAGQTPEGAPTLQGPDLSCPAEVLPELALALETGKGYGYPDHLLDKPHPQHHLETGGSS